jgi:transcriptional regulator with XRE-family HTH domain
VVKIAKGKYHTWLQEDNLIRIESWARMGLTDEQIAKNMGVNKTTLYDWMKKFPNISNSIKKGKAPIDFEVENALFKRAIGYEYEEVETIIEEIDGKQRKRIKKIKKVALPETSAMIFWLKNRKPKEWRKLNPVVEAKLNAETEKLLKEAESLSNESTGDVIFIEDIPLED